MKRIRDSKPGLAKYQIRRGCEQRAFAGLAQIPKPLVHVDEIERDARRCRFAAGIQSMPDITMLAEQLEKFLLVLRELPPEQPFQLDPIDHPQPDAAHKSRIDACIGDEAPALGAGIRGRGTRCGYVT